MVPVPLERIVSSPARALMLMTSTFETVLTLVMGTEPEVTEISTVAFCVTVMVSAKSDPVTRMVSLPVPPSIVFVPAGTMNVSLPAPPVRVASPERVSLPSLPLRTTPMEPSRPRPDLIVSSPCRPLMVRVGEAMLTTGTRPTTLILVPSTTAEMLSAVLVPLTMTESASAPGAMLTSCISVPVRSFTVSESAPAWVFRLRV